MAEGWMVAVARGANGEGTKRPRSRVTPTYARLDDPVRTPGPYLAAGRAVEEEGELLLALARMDPFHERERLYASG